MTPVELSLLDSLRELELAARRDAAARTPILPILERIDRLAADLPPDASADLRHYLQRKSYEKARLVLEGRAHENTRGKCH